MIRIAICDDELLEIDRARSCLEAYMQNHPQYEITINSFSAPLELLTYVAEHGGFDILLLDIYMAGMLGTDVARELRQLGDNSEFIFITTSRDHAIEAFEVEAAQYLVKPYAEEGIFAALDKIIQRIDRERRVIVILKTSEGITRLALRDVVFTETGRNNYQIVHTIQGKKMEVRMTASELFELLSQNKFFVRCGVSLNLNLKYIRQISKNTITFDTGESITYPYRSYQKLKEEFLRFQMFTEE
ncbi:transcriptional regulatory protein YpdB [Anaerotignum neopropionicum]|uniref:Stage 0 sporulation protein A homolog n=1 Tax=Anaerotignum neopropionicum TaxID=36847 RepID=A0A136WEJ6_9FIRM|nr:LytTR family DNA-binding domain-containing protein [Anaerotignum neopropionicum]KXL52935.1 transcriptional regulatory protein YpdB [Anaerotignum neopropionicum]